MEISNKDRQVSWEKVAKEFQTERDALKSEIYRLGVELHNRDQEIIFLNSKLDQRNWQLLGDRYFGA